jgi:hypothetical protein
MESGMSERKKLAQQLRSICLPDREWGDELTLKAAADMLEAEGWQPIESAPKDGSSILAYFPRALETGKPYLGEVWWRRDWMGPFSDGLESSARLDLCDPTHWMPLPSPPAV